MKIIAVKLSKQGEKSVKNRHPWIFSDSVIKLPNNAECGDVAVIFSFKTNKPIGVGLYDANSPIAIKMLHFGGGIKIDKEFFRQKIETAYSLRLPLLKTQTNAYRLIFGENDGFPGFIADVYDTVLVVKLYSKIWFPYLSELVQALMTVSHCKVAVLRLSRKLLKSQSIYKDGQLLFGKLVDETVVFTEHGVRFSANVIKGHKTGYFLDHRHNRKKVGTLSKNKTVLDVFSYAGGFSVHALVGGAKEVTGIDISKQALELALANGKHNDFSGTHNVIAGDAFVLLKNLINQQKKYDLVILDPPSFAKNKEAIPIAQKKYAQLTTLGAQLVKPNGILLLASCSSRISEESFFAIHKENLPNGFVLLEKTTHDLDHPVTFKEGAYLKTGYYKFLKS